MNKILLSIVSLGISLSLSGCGLNTAPGDGEKVGQIVKLSRQGLFCKTYEGQLIRGGMTGGSGTVGAVPFDFTIEDPSLVATVKEAMETQSEVKITYEMEGFWAATRSDSQGHFLKGIKIIGK